MRSLYGVAVASLALITAAPVLAADYRDLRPAYPTSWENGEDNQLRFETGVRYWYAVGKQSVGLAGETYTANDHSNILEGHFRIDDDLTSSFVKGQAGYAVAIDGDYANTVDATRPTFSGGQVGYIGADFGWTPLGNESVRLGALVGYQVMRESPDRARLDLAHIDGLNIHALRLGVTAHADLGGMFDIDAEAAVIPYAFASGATAELPSADRVVQGVTVNRTNTELTGALYGASGQVMVGFHPTENLTLRAGGRAWILTGPGNTTTKQWHSSTPNQYLYTSAMLEGLSLVRYGALVELTGRF